MARKKKKKAPKETQAQADTRRENERNKGPVYDDADRGEFLHAKTTEQLLYAKRDLELRNRLDDLEIEDVFDLIDEVVSRRETARDQKARVEDLEADVSARDEQIRQLESAFDDMERRLDDMTDQRDTLQANAEA